MKSGQPTTTGEMFFGCKKKSGILPGKSSIRENLEMQ